MRSECPEHPSPPASGAHTQAFVSRASPGAGPAQRQLTRQGRVRSGRVSVAPGSEAAAAGVPPAGTQQAPPRRGATLEPKPWLVSTVKAVRASAPGFWKTSAAYLTHAEYYFSVRLKDEGDASIRTACTTRQLVHGLDTGHAERL
jgi:hypothetical protein